jgi:hypothetical protein
MRWEPEQQTASELWAERLLPFYERLPSAPAPERHWDLVIRMAVGSDEALNALLDHSGCAAAHGRSGAQLHR